jgi:hypothetical protein
LLTLLYLFLSWFPFRSNPAPALRLFTPITPDSFASARVILAVPLALLSIYVGEKLGERLRPQVIRVIYNWAFLLALTAGCDLLLTGQWSSLNMLSE